MAEFLLGPATYKYEYKLKRDWHSGKMTLYSRNGFPLESMDNLSPVLLDAVSNLTYNRKKKRILGNFIYTVLEYRTKDFAPIFIFADKVVCDTSAVDLDELAHQMTRIDRHDFYHEIRIRAAKLLTQNSK